jgi:hypothetical protein
VQAVRPPRSWWSRAADRLVLADDDVEQRLARQRQLAHVAPAAGVARAHLELDHLRPEPADRDGIGERGGQRRLLRGDAQAPATASNVVPCSSVEMSTAKNTTLKKTGSAAGPSSTGNVARTDGHAAAQAGPRQRGALGHGEARPERADRHAERAREDEQHARDEQRVERVLRQLGGEDEQPEDEEEHELGHPRQPVVDVAMVRSAGDRRAEPSTRPAR